LNYCDTVNIGKYRTINPCKNAKMLSISQYLKIRVNGIKPLFGKKYGKILYASDALISIEQVQVYFTKLAVKVKCYLLRSYIYNENYNF